MSETIHDARYLILLDSSYVVRYFDNRGEAEVYLAGAKGQSEYKLSLVRVLEIGGEDES